MIFLMHVLNAYHINLLVCVYDSFTPFLYPSHIATIIFMTLSLIAAAMTLVIFLTVIVISGLFMYNRKKR